MRSVFYAYFVFAGICKADGKRRPPTSGQVVPKLIYRLIFLCKWNIIITCIDFNAKLKGEIQMELAKITMRGQITIPIEIRKRLGVKDGDKVIFLEENGRVIMENAAMKRAGGFRR